MQKILLFQELILPATKILSEIIKDVPIGLPNQ